VALSQSALALNWRGRAKLGGECLSIVASLRAKRGAGADKYTLSMAMRFGAIRPGFARRNGRIALKNSRRRVVSA
jgi:hypothetical protein